MRTHHFVFSFLFTTHSISRFPGIVVKIGQMQFVTSRMKFVVNIFLIFFYVGQTKRTKHFGNGFDTQRILSFYSIFI